MKRFVAYNFRGPDWNRGGYEYALWRRLTDGYRKFFRAESLSQANRKFRAFTDAVAGPRVKFDVKPDGGDYE